MGEIADVMIDRILDMKMPAGRVPKVKRITAKEDFKDMIVNELKKELSIDIETYCELDVREVGAYRYATHPSFEILMIAYEYAEDDQDVFSGIIDMFEVKDPDGEAPKAALDGLKTMLMDPTIIKKAYNANFERTCLGVGFELFQEPEQWRCTMVQASELGLPPGLAKVAKALGLPEDQQKMKEGKALIDYFSKPCKPTAKNNKRTRNLPQHEPERWQLFKDYCQRDVKAERAVAKILNQYPMMESEWKLWELDQEISDFGVRLDRNFVDKAAELYTMYTDELKEKMKEITKLANPNSLQQLKGWIQDKTGLEIKSLAKDKMKGVMDQINDAEVLQALEIRAELKKTSNAKYFKMQEVINDDDRARGLIQFYGAATGRWAGRLVQVQNLPRNYMEDLALARDVLANGDPQYFGLFYDEVSDALSQLLRTAFVPSEGNLFYISDFSAIEARVIAWLADEEWRMEVFNTHGKIYEASAAQMFKIDIDTIVKGHENYSYRSRGKIAELALGYGGSVGALTSMQDQMGLYGDDRVPDDECKGLVNAWRKTNPAIVQMWWDIGDAAISTVMTHNSTMSHNISFHWDKGILFIELPSGRSLAYVNPRTEPGRYGREKLVYDGYKEGRWQKIDTYGPKLVENIVQAIARDCLAFALFNLKGYGYQVVMHVHDEVIIDHSAAEPDKTMDHITEIMSAVPEWAEGLPLGADGYYSEFYKKD